MNEVEYQAFVGDSPTAELPAIENPTGIEFSGDKCSARLVLAQWQKVQELRGSIAYLSRQHFSGWTHQEIDDALEHYSGMIRIDIDHVDHVVEFCLRLGELDEFEVELVSTDPFEKPANFSLGELAWEYWFCLQRHCLEKCLGVEWLINSIEDKGAANFILHEVKSMPQPWSRSKLFGVVADDALASMLHPFFSLHEHVYTGTFYWTEPKDTLPRPPRGFVKHAYRAVISELERRAALPITPRAVSMPSRQSLAEPSFVDDTAKTDSAGSNKLSRNWKPKEEIAACFRRLTTDKKEKQKTWSAPSSKHVCKLLLTHLPDELRRKIGSPGNEQWEFDLDAAVAKIREIRGMKWKLAAEVEVD